MNPAFDERYDIRQARYDEIDEIMQFIDSHWKKGHILARNRKFFEYEYTINNKVNFLIARDKKSNEIESIIGFNIASLKLKDVWGACWKTRTDHQNVPFLGVELINRLIDEFKVNYNVVGVNPKTALPILTKIMGYYECKLNHFYRLNNKAEYKIAKIATKKFIEKNPIIKQTQPCEIFKFDDLKNNFNFSSTKEHSLYKDEWYYKHRFFEHPIYKYRVFFFDNAFFVAREQEANNSKILRIVDYAGPMESFGHLYNFFDELLKEYEYIDFYNYGFSDESLKNAGFINKKETPENIIPNYFSPFLQENIEIYAASKDKNMTYYKADADQDRPS